MLKGFPLRIAASEKRLQDHLKWSCWLWNYNANITHMQKLKCSSHRQNWYCLRQLQPLSAQSHRAPRACGCVPAQEAGPDCFRQCRLTVGCIWGCSRGLSMPHWCRLLLRVSGASTGWELRSRFAEAQHWKILLLGLGILRGEIHRAGSRQAEEGHIPDGRDMHDRSSIISLSSLFSTRCSQS